jgi:hypothetical protein
MRFLSVFFITTLCSCRAVGTTSHVQTSLEQTIEREIGGDAIIGKNSTATFALAYQSKNKSVEYVVIRLSDLKVVAKERIQGSVTWDGEMKIKVTQTPGIVKLDSKPGDNVKVIDLNNYIIQKK